MKFTPKHLLITGGAGFIGSHFIRYWQQRYPQHLIVNLDKITYAANLKNLKLTLGCEYHFVQGDILNQDLVFNVLRKYEIDTIVHFAAETHVDRSIQIPELFLHTNVIGTQILLQASYDYWIKERNWTSECCRFHHISTDEVYGSLKQEDLAFTEENPYRPRSPYSASKAAADHFVRSYFATYNLPITITHCSNNYGLFQHNEKFIPTIIRNCLFKQVIPVYGNGSNRRDWIHVVDHCNAIDQVIHSGRLGESYNIGGQNELSNLELISMFCEYFVQLKKDYDYFQLIRFIADRPGHDWRYAMNITKISQELGWQPTKTVRMEIEKLIRFYGMEELISVKN